ncbi:MAG TPA: Hpt domain-containing protein [Candidatus Babeliales bacterium]|nr:Hpt domain-containing protein [Candidatus Babeliales bacterium]
MAEHLRDLDAVQLSKLRDILGSEQLSLLLATFRDDLQACLTKLRDGRDQGDAGKIRFAAHELKGAAGNVGAARLADVAARLQSASSEGRDVAALMVELDAAAQSFSVAIRSLGT